MIFFEEASSNVSIYQFKHYFSKQKANMLLFLLSDVLQAVGHEESLFQNRNVWSTKVPKRRTYFLKRWPHRAQQRGEALRNKRSRWTKDESCSWVPVHWVTEGCLMREHTRSTIIVKGGLFQYPDSWRGRFIMHWYNGWRWRPESTSSCRDPPAPHLAN